MDNNSKKNLFWILSGVTVFILLVAWVVGWWMINDSTALQIQARDKVYSDVNGLPERTIPNTAISNVLDQRKEELTDIVYQIWEERHQAQQEHFQRVLTDRSKDAVEIINKDPEEITALDTDKYAAILANELARLEDVVNLRKRIELAGDTTNPDSPNPNNPGSTGGSSGNSATPTVSNLGSGGDSNAASVGGEGGEGQGDPGSGQQTGAGGRGGAAGPRSQPSAEEVVPVQYEGLVDWVDKNDVLGVYLRWEDKPSQAQVVYALEYWAAMYSVLDVISQTNGNVTHFEAPIKQIRALRIGRLGPKLDGGPEPPDAPSNQPNAGASDGGNNAPQLGTMGSGGGSNQSAQAEGNEGGSSNSRRPGAEGPDPAHHAVQGNWGLNGFELPDVKTQPADKAMLERFRYVDDNGYSLYAAKDNPHVEFRMIPMYLELVINQAEIDRFFRIAASSPLPIEVQQICAIHAIPANERDPNGPVDFGPQDVVLKVRGVIYKYQEPVRDNIGKTPAELVAAEPGSDAANP